MVVVFISNIVSINQVGVWDSFSKYADIDFTFLCTRSQDKYERSLRTVERQYAVHSDCLDDTRLSNLIRRGDVLIIGSVEDARVHDAIRSFAGIKIYSCEHMTKERNLLGFIRFLHEWWFPLRRKKYSKHDYGLPLSYLCAYDLHSMGIPRNHLFQFSYFLHLSPASFDALTKKQHSIVYSDRLIEWKHPEAALFALNYLSKTESDWHLDYFGVGDAQQDILRCAQRLGISEKCFFHGYVSHDRILKEKEHASIFVFGSDTREGYGVSLIEALEAGMICFANKRAGATHLLFNGKNMFVYSSAHSLKRALKRFQSMTDREILEMRRLAVASVQTLWSGETAADRLRQFLFSIQNRQRISIPKNGPLSSAYSFVGLIRWLFYWFQPKPLWKRSKR